MNRRPTQQTRSAANSSRLQLEQLEPRQMLAGDGLLGQYFDSQELTELAGTRVDPVVGFANDTLGNDAQGMVADDDVFSIRWTGWVKVDQSGQWQFTTHSNDGVRLWVNDTLVIDNWTTHTSTRDDGTINLSAGWHPIRLEYFQQAGTSDMRLLYSGPGQSESIIPQTHLCSTTPNAGDPVANAGPDRVVIAPGSSVTLDGSVTGNGSIATYSWTRLSGPNDPMLSGADTEDLKVSGLVQGVYEFQLEVTDNEGNSDVDIARVNVVPDTGVGTISGELKQWHKVTLDFQGPDTAETAGDNPFLNYRLDVTFTHASSGEQFVVPGYFAADGNAANTNASSGNVWRVHFAPSDIGEWTYQASFRSGANVAVSGDRLAGSSGGFFDGAVGVFDIAPTDKSGRDLRGKGRLEYVGERYLKFAGSGEYFLKQGPDAPENLLAYEDFDNTTNEGGRRKSYSAHAADWNPGDPSWNGGKGTELIGAVNYLASEGLNAVSFLPMNIEGDDKNVFPYLSKSSSDRTRMDVSKLTQWEIVLEHATQQGFFLHFKTQETENDQLLDGGALGTQRKLYYRELIARFSHHLALNWNLGEENTNTTQQRKDFAQFFYDNDPYRHHIVLHTYPGQKDSVYDPLLGNASKLTGASLQTSNANFSQVHADTVKWVNDSANSGKPWAIAVDEPGDAQHALRPDNDKGNSHEDGRKNALWGTLMGGGYGNEWYFGYGHAHSDLTLEDFRSRDDWWDYTRYALDFFNDNQIPFWQMQNDNSISTASNDYGFYKPGEVYVAYLKNGGSTSIDLTGATGQFEVRWFDPRNGGGLLDGSVGNVSGGAARSVGTAPDSTSQDWVVLVRKPLIVDQGPFGATAHEIADGSVIPFEDYDVGGEGKSYHDSDGISQGDHARGGGVDGGPAEGAIGERIGWTAEGEWLEYTVDTTAASYYASVRYSADANAVGSLRLLLGDGPEGTNFTELATFELQSTGDLTTWQYLTQSGILVDGGDGKVMRVEIVGGGFDLDQIEFSTETPTNTPPTVTIDNVTQVVEQSTDEGVYEEQGGLVVMEMENTSTTNLGLWNQETTYPNYTGDGYLQFTGNNTASGPPNSPLEYRFKINRSGLYYLHLRAARDTLNGQPGDHSNDAYVRVEGDYGAGPNAGNSHGDDAPLSMLKSNTKFFGGNANSFAWATGNRLDPGGHDNKRVAVYDFKAGEEYLLVMSGRSKFFSVDRIVFRHQSVGSGAAQSLSNSESPRSNGQGIVMGYQIDATVTDDGRDFYPPELQWTKVTGPGEVTFDNANAEDVLATFSVDGEYVLRLDAYDGEHTTSEIITINATMTPNIAPEVDAGADLSIKLPNDTVNLNGSVSDDNQPIGLVTSSWTVVSAPSGGIVQFGDSTSVDTTAQFNLPGNYVLQLSADDGDKSSSDEVTVTVRSELDPLDFGAIEDAYLQNGIRFNDEYLKVESGSRNRTSYLKFDVAGLEGFTVTNATLRLNVNGDPGSGAITTYVGRHNSWTETTIADANKPEIGAVLDSVVGSHGEGQTREFDVTAALSGNGEVTFVVQIAAGSNDVWFSSSEGAAPPELIVDVAPIPTNAEVVGRHLFYNGSAFDAGSVLATPSDDAAIATDKQPLQAGQLASFANYSSFDRGINGVMIDIVDLANAAELTTADFHFRIGNGNVLDNWSDAPTPVLTVREGAGEGGADRVTLIWEGGGILGKWLEVTTLANDFTGLESQDTFYFGSAPGETGNSDEDTVVNLTDALAVRSNMTSSAAIDNRYDFDRNGVVDGDDMQIAAENKTNAFTQLVMLDLRPVQSVTAAEVPGDFDRNGVVDGRDPMVWSADYGSTERLAADGTDDGIVSGLDYLLWQRNLGVSDPIGKSAPAGLASIRVEQMDVQVDASAPIALASLPVESFTLLEPRKVQSAHTPSDNASADTSSITEQAIQVAWDGRAPLTWQNHDSGEYQVERDSKSVDRAIEDLEVSFGLRDVWRPPIRNR